MTATAMTVTFKQIGEAWQPVSDPEIHMSSVDLGPVYGAEGKTDEKGGLSVKVTRDRQAAPPPYGPMPRASRAGGPGKRKLAVVGAGPRRSRIAKSSHLPATGGA